MSALTKLKLALLTVASDRPDGALLPAPEELAVAPNRARKAAGQLIGLGLAEERPVIEQHVAWRGDNGAQLGAFITQPGRLASAPAMSTVVAPAPVRQTKAHLVVELLSRADGASLDELVAATGWLPHTTRAAITMLKKKGELVERFGDRGASRYRFTGAA